jgi:hypothetical protein
MAQQTTGTGEGETVGLPVVGQEGDTCEQCGSVLATDQRYCLNCGWRRGEARVDYERRLVAVQPTANGAVASASAGTGQQWSPIVAIGAIALLGVFLLLGVLIGKKDNNTTQTVAAQAAPTTTSAAAPTPTDTTATTASKQPKANKAAAATTAPGAGNVVQGGSGNTNGIQQADTNASPEQNAKNGPDVVATGGAPEKLDPNGQAGGGSSATCIGC